MTFSNVKVGDKVWSFSNGFGVIIHINPRLNYSLEVKFEDDTLETFNYSGRRAEKDKYSTLFWDEVVFEVPEKPLPKLEVDAKVIVWDHGQKHNMHFSHFTEVRGVVRMCTFDGGKTSFTTRDTTAWPEFEVVNE